MKPTDARSSIIAIAAPAARDGECTLARSSASGRRWRRRPPTARTRRTRAKANSVARVDHRRRAPASPSSCRMRRRHHGDERRSRRRSGRAWSWPRRGRARCARPTARSPTSTRGTSSAARARRTPAGTAPACRWRTPSTRRARRGAAATIWIAARRPPAMRSSTGPINGARRRNGAKLRHRNSSTRPRASRRVDVEEQRVGERHHHRRVAAHHRGMGDGEPAELGVTTPAAAPAGPWLRHAVQPTDAPVQAWWIEELAVRSAPLRIRRVRTCSRGRGS